MASQSQKQQALNYLAQLLEASGLYDLHTHTDRSLLFHERGWVAEIPKTCELVIANFYTPIDQFTNEYTKNCQHQPQPIYTVPIFYKDGKTAFALLQDTPKFREHTQTLKLYTAEQKHTILHLRNLERYVLEEFGKNVTYYQPQTARLAESVRIFTLADVHLDYSHIPPEDPKYSHVQNRTSLDYKLPLEQPTLGPALAVEAFSETDYHKRARLISTEKQPQPALPNPGAVIEPFLGDQSSPSIADEQARQELQHAAQRAFPQFTDPQEALRIYLGEKA